MSKVAQRLLVFFVGIPIVLGILYFPVYYHLPFNIFVVLVSTLAAAELCSIFSVGGKTLPKPLMLFLCAAIIACSYIDLLIGKRFFLGQISFILSVFIIFATEIFSAKTFEKSNASIARSICVILYCAYFPSFIVNLTNMNNSFAYMAAFLVLVFISDSAAWLFGVLFGKNNRGKVLASPNKSIAGFVGAYVGCILFAYLFAFVLFPQAFDADNKAVRVLVLAVLVCTASIIGDLAESVFKRSSNVKDSGRIVLGRGGMMDCVDSIFMAAPFYYYTLTLLFGAAA